MKKQNWKDDFRPEASFGDYSPLENKIIIYQTEDGQTQVDVRMENETVWLSANQMAMLFERDEKTIRKHINNVFSDNEVDKESNTHFLRVAHSDKPVAFYTLDVIISVGYRVKSQRGVKFRQWANKILKQYLMKGYAVNDRLRRDQLGELRQLVQVVGRTLQHRDITDSTNGQALFDVVKNKAVYVKVCGFLVLVEGISVIPPCLMAAEFPSQIFLFPNLIPTFA